MHAGGETLLLRGCLRPVTELHYVQNPIADPHANAKRNEYVLAVSRDEVPADSVTPVFHRWLGARTRAHPDRVAVARLQPATSAA